MQLNPRHLRNWLWYWPLAGVLILTWSYFDPSAFERCPQSLWIPPLIGISAAGYSWIRTFDPRYLPPLAASMIFFAIGAWYYWAF